MYSQRDEEKYIIEFFKNIKGKFLDIGAYDGKTFSNTYQLALQGWRGVCIEPSPSVFPVLEALYKSNDSIKTIKVGVGNKRGKFPFYNFHGDAISSFDLEHTILWHEGGKRKYNKIMADLITVEDLFALVGFNFDFINIDAEGLSLTILEKLPFERLNMKMLCIEFDKNLKRIMQIANDNHFNLLHQTAENLILVKDE